jgi:phosphate:Na+ symporter
MQRRLIGLFASVFALAWLGSLSVAPGDSTASGGGTPTLRVAVAAAAAQDGLKAPELGDKGSAKKSEQAEQGKPASSNGPSEPARAGAESQEHKPLSWFAMAMSAIAGLVLFIFGVTQLAQGLGDLNSERMRRWTSRFTSNRLAGVTTGFVATTLLESSSVVIIMVIAMVSGGVLTFVQSLGVVLGANIGTAVGAQIIALDVEQYIPVLMLTGLLLLFVGKSETRKKLGLVVLGFGLMFYGLEAIDQAMKPLRDHEPFMNLMQSLGKTPLYGALFGAGFTVLIQSSSAVIAIVITLAGSGLIDLPAGVAIMLGAEIGTCSDTLVATIGRGRPALRTGVFHLVFNLISACIGVALAPAFVQFVDSISGEASVGRQIAHAQMIFNCVGVALVLPFLPLIARALERVIPDSRERVAPSSQAVPAQ